MLTASASQVGTTLFITEDTAVATPETITLTQDATHTTTTVTGTTAAVPTFVGLTDIVINLAIGGNSVTVDDANGFVLTGGMQINFAGGATGTGTNTVTFFAGNGTATENTLLGSLQINNSGTATGLTATLDNLVVTTGDLQISAGAGTADIAIGTSNQTVATTTAAFGVQVAGNVYVLGGDGSDTIAMDALLTAGNLSVAVGDGASTLTFGDAISQTIFSMPTAGTAGTTQGTNQAGASAQGILTISVGSGGDTIDINQFTGVTGGSIKLGDGTNNVIVENSSFGDGTTSGTGGTGGTGTGTGATGTTGGSGAGAFAIIGGSGTDNIDLEAVATSSDISLNGGGGTDRIQVRGSLVTAGTLVVDGGAGADTLEVDNSHICTLFIEAQGGDSATVNANAIDVLFADFGAGGTGSANFRNNQVRSGSVNSGGNTANTSGNSSTSNFGQSNFSSQGVAANSTSG